MDFWANAAWLTRAAMTVNLGRAIATLAGHGLGEATLGTLQRTLLAVPARLARSARHYHLHLPTRWPWQTALTWLKRRIDAPPHDHLTPVTPLTARHPRTRSTPTSASARPNPDEHPIKISST